VVAGVTGTVDVAAGIADVDDATGVAVAAVVAIGAGVGVVAATRRLTITWIGVPPAGVIVTTVLYTPGCR
jgi:hypothetical protein